MTARTWLVTMVVLASLGCGGDDDDDSTAAAGSSGSGAAGSGASGSTGGAAGGSGASGGSAGGASGGMSGGSGVGGMSGGSGQSGAAGAGAGGGGGTDGGGAAGAAAGGAGAAGGSSLAIAEWTDAPGVCPAGMPQRDITTLAQLQAATRGEGDYAKDAPATCYLIHDGEYAPKGLDPAMYVTKSGKSAGERRLFIGQSRKGVIVRGRATIEKKMAHLRISNLTFDLTGVSFDKPFNTLSLLDSTSDLRIDHIDFTGDCKTGYNGGHIETSAEDTLVGPDDVVIEACTIENYGRCGTDDGRQDHGIYLSAGTNLTVRNNDIRGNSSRGIQLYTQGGDYGTLDQVVIEQNRIHDNGHAGYEDGIVLNATDTGTIRHVTIQHNLFHGNHYSGVRVVGTAFDAIVIQKNTFFHDGASSAGTPSEASIDDEGSGAKTTFSRNIFVMASGVPLINSCYDAAPRGYAISDNVVQGTVPGGAKGSCVSGVVSLDPGFVSASGLDFHTTNAGAQGYGAYAP